MRCSIHVLYMSVSLSAIFSFMKKNDGIAIASLKGPTTRSVLYNLCLYVQAVITL